MGEHPLPAVRNGVPQPCVDYGHLHRLLQEAQEHVGESARRPAGHRSLSLSVSQQQSLTPTQRLLLELEQQEETLNSFVCAASDDLHARLAALQLQLANNHAAEEASAPAGSDALMATLQVSAQRLAYEHVALERFVVANYVAIRGLLTAHDAMVAGALSAHALGGGNGSSRAGSSSSGGGTPLIWPFYKEHLQRRPWVLGRKAAATQAALHVMLSRLHATRWNGTDVALGDAAAPAAAAMQDAPPAAPAPGSASASELQLGQGPAPSGAADVAAPPAALPSSQQPAAGITQVAFTAKYWVRLTDVSAVKARLLQHLPMQLYVDADGRWEDNQVMTEGPGGSEALPHYYRASKCIRLRPCPNTREIARLAHPW